MRIAAALAGVLLLGPALSAQLDLTATGGGLGRPARLEVAGQPGQPYLLFLSTRPGPLPLGLVDPGDPRALGLMLDVLPILTGLTGVTGPFLLPVPAEPSLAGLGVRTQALSLQGSGGRIFGPLAPLRALHLWPPLAAEPLAARMGTTRMMLAATLLPGGGRVLATGGGQGAMLALISGRETWEFDPVDRTIQAGPSLTTERGLHTATLLRDGRLLVAGGVNRTNDPQDTAELLDPAKSTSTPLAVPMGDKRSGHTASLLPDGRVLLAGGIADMTGMIQALGTIVSSTDLYDPATQAIAKGPALGVPRLAHLALDLPDGRVLLAGGASWQLVIILKVPYFADTTDLFDPKTNKIAPGPRLKTARAFSSAIRLKDGRFLLVGGASGDLTKLGAPTVDCELLDPATLTFTATGKLLKARAGAHLLLLDDGRVLAAGGIEGDLYSPLALTSGEIYDPATGTWSPGPSLTAGRGGAAAVGLPDGTLLLLGGAQVGLNGIAQDTCEVLHP